MKIFCDEDCIYRNKYAPFCGFCLQKIMGSEEKRRGVRQLYDKYCKKLGIIKKSSHRQEKRIFLLYSTETSTLIQ